MREYKFRAWDKYHKYMIEWEQFKSEATMGWFEDEELVIMQYTGIPDINGINIASGDICKDKDGVYWEVVFEKDMFKLVGLVDIGKRFLGYDLEIIGNVWENPEIIEEISW